MTTDELIIKAKSVVKELALDALKSQLAFMSWPIIGPIAGIFLSMIIDTVLTVIDNQGYFLYVTYQTDKQATKFDVAADQNLEALKNGTAEQKIKARADLINSARDLIRLRV